MIQLNILSKSYKEHARLEWRSTILWRTSIILIGLVVLSTMLIVGGIYYVEQETESVISQYVSLQTEINRDESTSTLLSQQKELSSIINVIASNNIHPVQWSDVLAKTHNALPSGVTLTKLEVVEGQIHITGTAQDRETFLSIRTALERTELFTVVDLPLSSLFAEGSIPFDMTLTLTASGLSSVTL